MRNTKAFAILLLTLMAPCALPAGEKPSPQPQTSSSDDASEAWLKEFNDVCSQTQDAMAMSVDQLRSLVQRGDRLEQQMDRLDETRRKVYSKRLQQCRGLFAYVLESKTKDKK